jgi:hypothetical protein
MEGYNFVIKYRPGKQNILADVLSRKDLSDRKTDSTEQVLLPKQRWTQLALVSTRR